MRMQIARVIKREWVLYKVKWPTKQTFFSGKTKWLIFVVFAGLVLVATGAFIISRFSKNEPGQKMVESNCSGDIAIAAARAMQASPAEQAAALAGVVERIKKVPQYDQDPNCLYPIMKQHLLKGEYTQAKELHSQFNKVYEKGFSGHFGATKKSVSAELTSTDVLSKTRKNNSINVGVQEPATKDKE